jgi:hypothetical protein
VAISLAKLWIAFLADGGAHAGVVRTAHDVVISAVLGVDRWVSCDAEAAGLPGDIVETRRDDRPGGSAVV